MANFDRLHHWTRFEPQLANNLELPLRDRLALEIATGLSVAEVEAFTKAQSTAAAAAKGELPRRPGPEATAEENAAYIEAAKAEMERMRTAQAQYLAPLWAPFVRLVPGNHTINGKPVATLADYLGLVLTQHGLFNYFEIPRQVLAHNSISGNESLFSLRPFGGSASTDDESNEPEGRREGGR